MARPVQLQMRPLASENPPAPEDVAAYRDARRRANKEKATSADLSPDPQGLVEFACECTRADCDRSVRVPLYVYRRIVDASDQYLLQRGHHAFATYRTIVTSGLMSIEERG